MEFVVNGEKFESKFNFYSLDYANAQYEKEKCEDVTSVYNNLLIYNKFESLVQALLFIFAPKNNGGITRDKVIQGLEEFVQNDGDIEELIDDVLTEMEESGFFLKTLKKANRMMEVTMKDMAKKRLDPVDKAEMEIFQSVLARAKERELI